jgi:hypothetical protein
MSRRVQVYLLVALLSVLGLIVYRYWFQSPAAPEASSANDKFQPLAVENPSLRMDLLQKIRKFEYTGQHRNIFTAILPPPPPPKTGTTTPGPVVPPPPPPLDVPVKFFGYVCDVRTGTRRAFFTNGEDVFILAEGETLLSRFRLVHIGNSSVDLEEIATGRRATLVLEESSPGS